MSFANESQNSYEIAKLLEILKYSADRIGAGLDIYSQSVTDSIIRLLDAAQRKLNPEHAYYLALMIEKLLATIDTVGLAKYNRDEKIYNVWDTYRYTSWWVTVLGPNLYVLCGTLGAADRQQIAASVEKIKFEYATLTPRTNKTHAPRADENSLTSAFYNQISIICNQCATTVNAAAENATAVLSSYIPAGFEFTSSAQQTASDTVGPLKNVVAVNALSATLDALIKDCDSKITTAFISSIKSAANNLSPKNAYIYAKVVEEVLNGTTSYGIPKAAKGEAIFAVTSTHAPGALGAIAGMSLTEFASSIGGLASCGAMYGLFHELSEKDQTKILKTVEALEKKLSKSELAEIQELNATVQDTLTSTINATVTSISTVAEAVVTNGVPIATAVLSNVSILCSSVLTTSYSYFNHVLEDGNKKQL